MAKINIKFNNKNYSIEATALAGAMAVLEGHVIEMGKSEEPSASEGLEFLPSRDGTYYVVSGIGTCTDTDIVIPSTYEGLPVTKIYGQGFMY